LFSFTCVELILIFIFSGKGGKNPRRRKNENEARRQSEEDKEYVRVTKMLGYDRLKAECSDGLKLLCQIPDELQEQAYIIFVIFKIQNLYYHFFNFKPDELQEEV